MIYNYENQSGQRKNSYGVYENNDGIISSMSCQDLKLDKHKDDKKERVESNKIIN